MLERINPVLRIVCLGLGALVLSQATRLALRKDPLAQLHIPTLLASTSKPAATPASTNASQTATTNRTAPKGGGAINPVKTSTNAVAVSSNSTAAVATTNRTGAATNLPTVAARTNSPSASTNLTRVSTPLPLGGPGIAPGMPMLRRGRGMGPGGMGPGGPSMAGPPQPELPPAVKTNVDQIVESEIFGPVPHPLPMALLGIAGKDVFLRAPSGQTGLLRVGEELGGIKVLQIGTNRVLVEEAGQPKELTIFAGFGSETLMPKGKENSP